jgi:hypothetical protein
MRSGSHDVIKTLRIDVTKMIKKLQGALICALILAFEVQRNCYAELSITVPLHLKGRS